MAGSSKRSARGARLEEEWVGGRAVLPLYVTEGEPQRPELVVWLRLPEGLVVAHDMVIDPKRPALAQALSSAMHATGATPKRLRVADHALEAELVRAFGRRFEIRVAPTPEMDDLLEGFLEHLPGAGHEQASYLEGGRVKKATVSRMFRAAQVLYRCAPWKVAADQQVLRLDIPALGVEGACVSILGALGESLGLVIFPSYLAFDRFLSVAAGPPPTRTGRIDLGTDVLALDYWPGADLPASQRREIAAHAWPVAGATAYPTVTHRDRDGTARPVDDREVRIAAECAFALAGFFARHRELFEGEGVAPVSESFTTDGSDVTVRLTMPYGGSSQQDLVPAPPVAARPAASKAGRNDPCPCGSGKKYKKCCLDSDDAARGKERRRAEGHELDGLLVAGIRAFAEERFDGAWHTALRSIDRALGPIELAASIAVPWSAYGVSLDGRPVVDWFVEAMGGVLSPNELAWLSAQQKGWLGIWEVLSVEPGVGMSVRDLLTGEARQVLERSGSRSLVARDAVLGRVVDYAGVSVFCGMHPRILAPEAAAGVIKTIRRRARVKAGSRVFAETLRGDKLGLAMLREWTRAVRAVEIEQSRPKRLSISDGERFLLTTDRFAFEADARSTVEAGLLSIEGVEAGEEPGKFCFVRPGNRMHSSWENTIVGHACLEDGVLKVSTNSVERADRLRALLEGACGQLVRHRTREHEDPLSSAAPPGAHERLPPPPEALEALREFKEAHYRGWLDQPVPTLGGRTPRAASKTVRGREELDVLLRTMENHEHRSSDGAAFDFSRLRRELDLR